MLRLYVILEHVGHEPGHSLGGVPIDLIDIFVANPRTWRESGGLEEPETEKAKFSFSSFDIKSSPHCNGSEVEIAAVRLCSW